MKSLAWVLILISPMIGHAQWGVGLSPGMSCPYGYRPGAGSASGDDEISNIRRDVLANNARITRLSVQVKELTPAIDRDKDKMGSVLTTAAVRSIEDHYRLKNDYASYQLGCGSAPVTHANDVLLPGQRMPTVESDRNLYPPPGEFCYNDGTKVINTWASFVENEGTVNSAVCDYYIPRVERSKNRDDRDRCHDGIEDYYKVMAKKIDFEKEIAALKRENEQFKDRVGEIQNEITEGTYCATCYAQKHSYSNGSDRNVMSSVMSLLAMATGRGRSPMGGYGYPSSPYAARVPGYYGMGPGNTYGGVPGSIGAGSFGCQGSNPLAMGNPMATPNMTSIFGGASPFNNPFAAPSVMPLFNQGAGPWGFPQYGNGVNPMMMNPMMNPAMNPFAMQNPNSMLNPMMNPYSMFSPYNMNPMMSPMMNPAMNPFAMQNPYSMLNPMMNPYSMFSPYSPMGPYSMMTPYGGGYPGYGGYPNFYGGTPNYGYGYGYPFGGGNPNMGFYSQMDMLRNNVSMINNGLYFGGGTGGNYFGGAPAFTNFQSTPIFNTPAIGGGTAAPAFAPFIH